MQTHPQTGRRCTPWLWAAAAAALACSRQPPAIDPTAAASSVRFSVQKLTASQAVSASYDLSFWFLDQSPPALYNHYTLTPASGDGRALAVLPCYTRADGSGKNQVMAVATFQVPGQPKALTSLASAVFDCTRNGDTAVHLVFTVAQTDDGGGFGDVGLSADGVACQSSIGFRGDDFLAVCGSSSCGDARAAFLFANACEALDGSSPIFWACGAPSDWTVSGPLAKSQFPVPPRDGSWTFGAAAMPAFRLPAPDPSLTDAQGNLRVWSGVPSIRARLAKQGGMLGAPSLEANRRAEFAAQLTAPPLTAGGASPDLLLEIDNGASGATALWWKRFAACDAVAARFDGLYAVDVRLQNPASAVVLLATSAGGLASRKSICTAAQAAITCTPPGAL